MSLICTNATPYVVAVDVEDCAKPTSPLVQRLNSACDAVEDAPAQGVLELRIRGCTDEALPSWPGDSDLDAAHKWEKVLRRLDRLPGVTLAVAFGRCSAGTLDLLAAADHRIADLSLRLCVRTAGGISWPSMAMYRLAARAGLACARSVFMFETELDGPRARESGLVDQVVEDAVRARDKFIASLSLIDLKALGSRRLLLLEGMGQGYERAVGLHLAACDAELRRVRACATAVSAPGQTPEHASVE